MAAPKYKGRYNQYGISSTAKEYIHHHPDKMDDWYHAALKNVLIIAHNCSKRTIALAYLSWEIYKRDARP